MQGEEKEKDRRGQRERVVKEREQIKEIIKWWVPMLHMVVGRCGFKLQRVACRSPSASRKAAGWRLVCYIYHVYINVYLSSNCRPVVLVVRAGPGHESLLGWRMDSRVQRIGMKLGPKRLVLAVYMQCR